MLISSWSRSEAELKTIEDAGHSDGEVVFGMTKTLMAIVEDLHRANPNICIGIFPENSPRYDYRIVVNDGRFHNRPTGMTDLS
jgi:hypothetical protein